jgi:quaternary ammonium compound-resistance protein SugE
VLSFAWICLIIAGLLEPCWAVSLKMSDRFRKVPWAVATVIFLACSLYLLSVAMAELPVGTSYAVWTGIGAVGTLAAGVILFEETATAVRISFAFLVIAGIVGLQITGV